MIRIVIFVLTAFSFIEGEKYFNSRYQIVSINMMHDDIHINQNTTYENRKRKFDLVIVVNYNFYSSNFKLSSAEISEDSADLSLMVLSEFPDIKEYGITHIEFVPEDYTSFPGHVINPMIYVTTEIPYYTGEDLAGQYIAIKEKMVYDLLLKSDYNFTLIESKNTFRGRKEQDIYSGSWRISKGILYLDFPSGDTILLDVLNKWKFKSHKAGLFKNKSLMFRIAPYVDEDEDYED